MPRTAMIKTVLKRLNCRHNCFNLPEIQINDCWLKNTCESCNKLGAFAFDESPPSIINDLDENQDFVTITQIAHSMGHYVASEEYTNDINGDEDSDFLDEDYDDNSPNYIASTKKLNGKLRQANGTDKDTNLISVKQPIRQNPERKAKTKHKDKYYKRLHSNGHTLVRPDVLKPLVQTKVKHEAIEKREEEPIVELIKCNNSHQIQKTKKGVIIDINSNKRLGNKTEKTENRTKEISSGTAANKTEEESDAKNSKEKKIKTTVIEIHTEEEPSMRYKGAVGEPNGTDDFMYEYNEELQACCEISLDETAGDLFEIPTEPPPLKLEDVLNSFNLSTAKCEPNGHAVLNDSKEDDNTYKCHRCSATFHRKCKLDAHINANKCQEQKAEKEEGTINEDGEHFEYSIDVDQLPDFLQFLDDDEQDDEIKKEIDDSEEIFYNSAKRSKMSNIFKLTKPYECDICHRSFSSRLVIEKHFMKKHSATPIKSCRICNKEFATAKLLRRHWRTHEAGPYKCKICSKELSGLIGLEMHMRIHTGERPFKCKICFRSFAQTSSLSCHVRTHTGEKPYQCSICKKSFSQSSSLAAHRYVHTGQKPHACEHCDKTFAIRPQLRKHILNRHSGTKPYKCDQCGKSYIQKMSLRYHMQRHTRENILHCKYCPKTFVRPVCLTLHMMRMHSRDAGASTDLNIGIKQSLNIPTENHLQLQKNSQLDAELSTMSNDSIPDDNEDDDVNEDEDEKIDLVPEPGNADQTTHQQIKQHLQQPYTSNDQYDHMHFSLSHLSKRTFSCDMCGQAFSQFKQVKRHIRKHRRLLKSFCDICKRQFTQRGSLLRHMHIHTGERPFKCEICSKAFAHISYLTNHRYIHDAVKPYPCDFCDKSFVIARALKKHMLRHAGVKPYKCSFCFKTYMNKQSLDYHLQRHTGENLLQCELCPKKFVRSSYLEIHMRRHIDGLRMYKCKNPILNDVDVS